MKKLLLVLCVCICIVTNSCQYSHKTENNDKGLFEADETIEVDKSLEANDLFEVILETMNANDIESLTELFSTQALESDGFAEQLQRLLQCYEDGEIISTRDWGLNTRAVNDEDEQGNTMRLREAYASYDVHTSSGVYRIAFAQVREDTENPSRVGLLSLYVLKLEINAKPTQAYRGDGQYIPGIHIGVY